MRKRIKNINAFISNPIKTQENVLAYLVLKAKETQFGKEHKFSRIYDYKSFKNQIPVRDYNDLSPYINKARNGEKEVLWPGKIKWFAKSSGTTNSKSKFIPISKESLYDCHFKAGKDMLSLYENNYPNTNIYNGKGLMLGGSISNSLYGDYKEGDLSAILLAEFPFWVSYHRIPDIKTAVMNDWKEKLDRIAKQAMHEDITNLTGVPSWMLILLKKVLELSGKRNISEVWPNLELYMHGGVNFGPYKKQFQELIPSKRMNYIQGYNASEGFLAIQDQHNTDDMLLMLDYGIFYEFIQIDDLNKCKLDTINLSEVKLNQNYAIVISTNSGLWRYLIGDVIQFTSISPFRVKVIGRTKSCINTFGEELMVHNTDNAIINACEKLYCSVKEYTVAPLYIDKGSGGHQWFIEFERKPNNPQLFMKEIDKELKRINSDYEAKRTRNIILDFPKLVLIENNEFYLWLKENNRLGGQYKVPRLNEDRVIANRLLSLKEKFSTINTVVANSYN
ncbi:MAG: hypothetical protein CMD16_00610 [Flavobacteriales bacterium]|nr:hypothetical protein [Flavobacteriales bacterium]|tara:strand:- start:32114 stop:33628 length:1515 start_codon:yes stop_codon:yes gene_type:complete